MTAFVASREGAARQVCVRWVTYRVGNAETVASASRISPQLPPAANSQSTAIYSTTAPDSVLLWERLSRAPWFSASRVCWLAEGVDGVSRGNAPFEPKGGIMIIAKQTAG